MPFQKSSGRATPWRANRWPSTPPCEPDGDGAARTGGDDSRQRRFDPGDAGAAALAALALEVEVGVHPPHRLLDVRGILDPAAQRPLAQVFVDGDIQASALGVGPQGRDGADVGAGRQRIDAQFRQPRREIERLQAAFVRQRPVTLGQRRIGRALGVADQDQRGHEVTSPFSR